MRSKKQEENKKDIKVTVIDYRDLIAFFLEEHKTEKKYPTVTKRI